MKKLFIVLFGLVGFAFIIINATPKSVYAEDGVRCTGTTGCPDVQNPVGNKKYLNTDDPLIGKTECCAEPSNHRGNWEVGHTDPN